MSPSVDPRHVTGSLASGPGGGKALVIQVVPQLPPPFEGVGTYAARLSSSPKAPVSGYYEIGDHRGETGDSRSPVTRRPDREVLDYLHAADRPVLPHYVNYAYSRRGCPWWLLRVLRSWRRQARKPLITMATRFALVAAPGSARVASSSSPVQTI